MNLMLDQQPNGHYIVIDETGKQLSAPIRGRTAAYAKLDELERRA